MNLSKIDKVMSNMLIVNLMLFFLTSCVNNEKKENEREKDTSVINFENQEVTENGTDSVNVLPDSMQINRMQDDSENNQTLSSKAKSNSGNPNSLSLSDFGVKGDGSDETKKIQEALNRSKGKSLIIPKQIGDHYLSGQLLIPSNIQIKCEPGVVFLAKNSLNQDYSNFEVLFRFEDVQNIIFDGQGAVFKMNKENFKKEFNHLFMINGSKNVSIKNVKALNSGGDGIYIGALRSKNSYPQDITIENCTSDNNRRQGLSITSGVNITVVNSAFNNSKGTDPAAGLDIEPGNSKAILKNIRIKDCQANNNTKRGFVVILNRLNQNSEPVDVVFENCTSTGNLEGFSSRQFRGVQGNIKFVNCVARNSKNTGFTESSCLANSIKKVYQNCIAENSNTSNKKMKGYLYKASFYLSGYADNRQVIGNSEFINCKSVVGANSQNVDYGMVVDNGDFEVKNISINNFETKGSHNNDKIHVHEKQMKALSIK